MILFDAQRPSDSPFVELVWSSHSEGAYPFLSIAVSRLELVVSKLQGKITLTVRGPETRPTSMGDCPPEGEWLGMLLKPGVFLPHLLTESLVDNSIDLPTVSQRACWLDGSSWQLPTYENADTFVNWLVRKGLLVRDPLVEAALQGQLNELTPRSVQYRFLQSLGISQNTVRQIERARSATYLLQQGVSILDTVLETGYYDQAHLSRSLKRFIGLTPAQLLHHNQIEQLSLLYKTTPFP